jgi:hypothetical protein
MIKIIKSDARHHANFGWLDTHWHFSFDSYYDPSNMNWGALRVRAGIRNLNHARSTAHCESEFNSRTKCEADLGATDKDRNHQKRERVKRTTSFEKR